MGNRGFEPLPSDWDGRGEGTSDHSTNRDLRHTMTSIEQTVAGRTSVGEQCRAGGFTSDRPYSDNGSLPPAHKYQGGYAGSPDNDGDSDYNTAAERGTSTPTPGVTY